MNRHQDCKFFGYRACEYRDNEIMKKATQDIPEYHGGKMPILSFPLHEEIDAICSICDKFTQVLPKQGQ